MYADADEVALLVNGTEIGHVPGRREHRHRAEFDATYEPGEVDRSRVQRDGGTRSHHAPDRDRAGPPRRPGGA